MIDREKTVKGLEWIVNLFGNYERHAMDDEEIQSLNDAIMLLKEQETIIRCKDCKYNSGNCHGLYAQFVTCYKTGSAHRENWYCADGERR